MSSSCACPKRRGRPLGPGGPCGCIFGRGPGPDFSERDRALLTLLRPHLHQAYLDAERRRHPVPQLTPRHWDLLKLVAAGHTNAQIARRLGISEGTVRTHLENIYTRLKRLQPHRRRHPRLPRPGRGVTATRASKRARRACLRWQVSWSAPVLTGADPGSGRRVEGREAIVCERRSATGSAVELFPEDVRVSGVPGGLARHVGHDPPERVPVAVDRDDEARFRVAGGTDRAVAVLDRRPVVPQHVGAARLAETVMPCSRPTSQAVPVRWWPNQYRSASARCWTRPRMEVPLSTRTRRSCSSDSPSAFFSTQCRANDRNARAVSSSPESTRGTGSRWVSAMPPR